MSNGKVQNVGNFSSPFQISDRPSQGTSDSIMGMRGSDVKDRMRPTVQVTPPSTGGGSGNVQNVGQLDPGANPIK